MERRLAAVLAADVVGYSRLMGLDEAGTLEAVKAVRRELVDGRIARHEGRIVKLIGDGILAEFPSVVNAVACAADIQRAMALRNADIPEERRIQFRIGVNLGDIILEDNDIFGDGVNIAARLESVAKHGGIAVSAAVRDNVGNRLDVTFEDAGEKTLKNIERPVRVYDVVLAPSPRPVATATRADPEPSAAAGKPSVAVLPFNNMSGDPEQEYFADGITEDIITDLSKVSGLSVIARNSAFMYKGKLFDVQEVARRFNVATVLEGSVRKAGQRVRINAQLIRGKDGTHIWADRYDRDLTDIFAIQDEITQTIVGQLRVRLLPDEKQAIESAHAQNFDAYNQYLQGRHFYRLHTTSHVLLAQRLFRKAVELDPAYARAYAGLADCAWFLYRNHHEGTTVDEMLATSSRALELDPGLAEAHASHGMALHNAGRPEQATAEFEEAIRLDPNLFEAFLLYADACKQAGEREKAAQMYARASELAPDEFGCTLMLSQMCQDLGRDHDAREAARDGLERAERRLAAYPDIPLPASLGATTLARRGERERALDWASRALTIAPDDPLTQYNTGCVYSLLGETDRAIEVIERWCLKANAASKTWLATDSDFDPIRADPRFQALLQRLG